jgi:hypothetical protein
MISYRPAVPADAGSLLVLMRSFPAPTQPGEQFVLPCLETKVSDPHSSVAVLEEDGALIGYISGHCHLAFYAGGKTAWVDEILIRPQVPAGRGFSPLVSAETHHLLSAHPGYHFSWSDETALQLAFRYLCRPCRYP